MSTWVRWLMLFASLLLLPACEQLAGGSEGSSTPPRIVAVSIPESIPGNAVAPTVEVIGDIASWDWEFGTGATPDATDIPAPTITLGPTGAYTGSLTIADYRGRSATASFDYRVLKLAPPIVAGITPTGEVGHDHAQATFSAEVAGEVTSWSWNFGAGASPSTSTDSQPTVTLQDPGSYKGTLEVCGLRGCSSTSFEYSVRVPVLTWSMTPFQAEAAEPVLLTTPDGRLMLFFQQVLPGDIGLEELWMATATPAATPGELNWDRRMLTSGLNYSGGMHAVIADDQVILCTAKRIDFQPVAHLKLIPLDGGPTTTVLLPSLLLHHSTVETPRLLASGGSLFLAISREVEEKMQAALMTTRVAEVMDTGSWTGFKVGGEGFNTRNVFDLIDLQGQVFMAQSRPDGDQRNEPGTAAVGRLHGAPRDGATAWTIVDIDRGARSTDMVRFIPTTSGLHLLYASYQQFRGAVTRHGWTANRQFNSSTDWQTGRFQEPTLRWAQAMLVAERPLVLGAVPFLSAPNATVALHRGFSLVGGAIPWTGTAMTSSGRSFGETAASTAGGAGWVALIEYQDSSWTGGGNSGEIFEYPIDPILMIGRVGLE